MSTAFNIMAAVFASNVLMGGQAVAQETVIPQPELSAELINGAPLSAVPEIYQATPAPLQVVAELEPATGPALSPLPKRPDPAVARLQILLDRAGTSPGVIDGFDGDNVRKAVRAFETMQGLPADGALDPDTLFRLDTSEAVIGSYTIAQDDLAGIVAPLPRDYAELAQRDSLGYERLSEKLAERFHMDEQFLIALNPGARFEAGETLAVAAYGPDRTGEVIYLEADKTNRQLRGYGADGSLLVAYPATIGSEDNPSPSGTHVIEAIAPEPTYTYNPAINFQQGENTQVLTLPPGPNGPVGSMWIDLSEPTYGIHGTPEPSLIDKVGSHGCIRLTNWDATELAQMVKSGVGVAFLG